MTRPVMLVVLDGFGIGDGGADDATARAHTPFLDQARREHPCARIETSGEAVGNVATMMGYKLAVIDDRADFANTTRFPDAETVIAGDMNTSPFVWLTGVIPVPAGVQDDRLEKFVRARGYATPVTDSGPTSQWLGMRLDALYTKGVEVRAQSVRASDHMPLWAEIVLARQDGNGD